MTVSWLQTATGPDAESCTRPMSLAPPPAPAQKVGVGAARTYPETMDVQPPVAATGAIKFGETTHSYDADGDLLASLPVPPLTLEELNAAATEFVGDLMQTPPMVSAVKKDGVPLYKLARKGIEVPREPRLVHIYNFRFSAYQEPLAYFRIACTKGTYVRSIAHDLGQKLGCGGHLATLRRVISGKFDVANAIPLAEVLKLAPRELEKRVMPFLRLMGA